MRSPAGRDGARRLGLLAAVVALLLVGTAQLVDAAPSDSFSLAPGSLSITAKVGETRTADVRLTARKPVVIETEFTDSHFADTGAGTCSQTYLSQGLRIPGKATCTIRVAFSSASAGTFNGTLRVWQCTAWHADADGALRCDVRAGSQTVALTGTAAGQPDLTVEGVGVTGSAATLPFTWTATVRNVGDATINVKNVAIDAAYSADASAGEDTAACGGVVSTSNQLLRPGDGYDVVFSCTAPPPQGSSHLVVQVDAPNAVNETSEANNVIPTCSSSASSTVSTNAANIVVDGPGARFAFSNSGLALNKAQGRLTVQNGAAFEAGFFNDFVHEGTLTIGAGTFSADRAAADPADPEAGNVPYAIRGRRVADRVSIYYASAYSLTAPDGGRAACADMRRGC